jgi:hypothetical protein
MHTQWKWQGSGTSSSETIVSLSRVYNFSSNIINVTLKSIFVKHLNTHGRVCGVMPTKGCKRIKTSSLPAKITFRQLQLRTGNWGECETQYKSQTMFPPNMFWLYWNWIFIFSSSPFSLLSQYICPKLLDQLKREIGFKPKKTHLFLPFAIFFFFFFIESISV